MTEMESFSRDKSVIPDRVKRHTWHFTAINLTGANASAGAPVLIAVCADCGLIRSDVVRPRDEARIDVSGHCAG